MKAGGEFVSVSPAHGKKSSKRKARKMHLKAPVLCTYIADNGHPMLYVIRLRPVCFHHRK